MTNLLMSLTLVVVSVVVVAVTGILFWCWVNRSRLRNWKFWRGLQDSWLKKRSDSQSSCWWFYQLLLPWR